jgi:uncharacterized glyoxalase superfamily protein PhnB
MDNKKPVLAKINLVARNYEATLKFYRLLGLIIPDPTPQPPGSLHAEAENPDGLHFALDNENLARIYNAAWRKESRKSSVLMTAFLNSRNEVDETYGRLVKAGFTGQQPPYDAFWGARYAIVADPEGNDVGLESPIDENMRRWPPINSPDQ